MDKNRAQHRGTRLPKIARFKLVRPPIMPELSDEELRARILDDLDARELAAMAKRKAEGRRAMGMKRVLSQNWQLSPTNKEDLFGSIPNTSGPSKWATLERRQRLLGFVRDYRTALEAFVNRQWNVVFPEGTWMLRQRYAVACQGPPI